MCLGLPMQLVEMDTDMGVVELGGVRRRISLQLMEDVQVGDYLLIHAGFAISKVDEEEALATMELLYEMTGEGAVGVESGKWKREGGGGASILHSPSSVKGAPS